MTELQFYISTTKLHKECKTKCWQGCIERRGHARSDTEISIIANHNFYVYTDVTSQ